MVKQFKLSNGIRVVCEHMASIRSVVLGIWVGAGSRHEPGGAHGVSHFIEHMLFKGTQGRTAKQIAEEIDFIGGHINAFTAKDCTCFYTKTLDSHLSVGADILSDIIYNPKLSAADIDLERNVILEEINMIEDTPDELAHDLLAERVWRGCTLGIPILGDPESLSSIDAEAIRRYMAKRYTPCNMVISAAGCFDDAELLSVLERTFGRAAGGGSGSGGSGGSASSGGVGGSSSVDVGIGNNGGSSSVDNGCNGGEDASQVEKSYETVTYDAGVSLRQKDTEQINLCVGFDGIALGDDDVYPLHLANCLFGGGMSSVLFQKVREELGLVYSIYSYISSYKGGGLYTVYTGMQMGQAARVFGIVLDELYAFKKSGVTDDLLNRAKEQFKGSFVMGLESPNARMSALGKSELLLGYINTPDEIVAKIEKVTLDDAYAVMDKIFAPDKLAVSAVGRIDGGLEKVLTRDG